MREGIKSPGLTEEQLAELEETEEVEIVPGGKVLSESPVSLTTDLLEGIQKDLPKRQKALMQPAIDSIQARM